MRAARAIAVLSLILTAAAASTGCQNNRNDDADRLRAENERLRAQLNAPRPAAPARPAPTTAPALTGLDTSYDTNQGTLTVTLPGDVLFAPGAATLKPSSKAALNKIATALQSDYAGKHARVDGYTDTDPVRYTKAKWGDNQALSEARAQAVYTYLVAHGVAADNLSTEGHGPANPKATKAKSRRVEVVVQVR